MTSKKVTEMQVYLANMHVLYQKYRNYHWNIIDPQFNDLHAFFEGQYTQLSDQIDLIAERIRMLDEHPKSSMRDYLDIATLDEDEIQTDKSVILPKLIEDTDGMIAQSKKLISVCEEEQDVSNADVVTEILQSFEKTRWMLKSLS